ncbi:hypothetical protein SLS56_008290 [Neofusicoccum ribis]|uniref:Uncharacterized protein n=1 Tax=Neofusicoccum ribis TaxID=45134 RepID=A0ABR3SKL1_9PEZI
MPSTRSAGRAKIQKAKEERQQRQQDRQWVLTDALLNSPNALKPENIGGNHNNAEGGRQDRLNQLSGGISDAARRYVDPQVLFFLDLMVKAKKAVAQAKETRGRSVDHLSAYLRAFKRDVTSWADSELSELSEAQRGSDTHTPGPNSSNSPAAQPAAEMPPPPIHPRGAQPQRKTAQPKTRRSLIVRLKVHAFPTGKDSSTTTTTTTTSSSSSSSSKITSRKRHATKEPAIADPPASKKTRTLQEDSSSKAVTVQHSAGPVRRSGRKAPITMPPQPQVSAGSQQEGSDSETNELGQLSSNINKATGSSRSGANKRKATMNDADDELVPEQATKRRRAAAPQSKAPRTTAVKKAAKATTVAAAAPATPAARADPTAPAPAPIPTPAPSTTTHAALPPRQRNGAGPVTGRDGFELIGPEPRFKLGQNDADLLTLRFYRNDEAGNRVLDSHTWSGKTDNRTPADIDWNNPKDIKILNKWMLQYLSRTWKCNGLRPDMMSRVWMDEEFEWLANQARHYHYWSKDDMPNQRKRMDEFNEEWEGEQIPFLNMEGEEVVTQPRPERTVAAIASAMRRDEEAHPERWVGTHLEGRSKVKREGAKGKEEGEEGEEEL